MALKRGVDSGPGMPPDVVSTDKPYPLVGVVIPAVANPCEAKTDEDRRGNREPLDLTRRTLAS